MAYTPDKCLSELKKVIDKLREVKFKDIIKADDDNLKIDALKWIYNTLYSMSDMFSYGDYLSKVSNLISKLKYVKDCPYDYEECLKHPEYFVYSDLHSNIIDTIINVKNALENLEPPCEEALDYINKLKDRVKWLWKPKTGFIVMSRLHNEIRSILKLIYDTLMIIFKKCYFPQCWDWRFELLEVFGDNCNRMCSRYSSGGIGNVTIIDKIASFVVGGTRPYLFNIGRFESREITNISFYANDYIYILRGDSLEVIKKLTVIRPQCLTFAGLRTLRKCDLVYCYQLGAKECIYECVAIDENYNKMWSICINKDIAEIYSIDCDNDKKAEIVVAQYAYVPTSCIMYSLIDEGKIVSNSECFPFQYVLSAPVIADIDDDGEKEIVGVAGTKVYCLKLPNLEKKWEFELEYPEERMYGYYLTLSRNPRRLYYLFFLSQDEYGWYGDYYLLSITPSGNIEFTTVLDRNALFYYDLAPIGCICDFDGDGFDELLTCTTIHLWYYDADKETFYAFYEFTTNEYYNYEIPWYFTGFDINNDGLPEAFGIAGRYLWLIDPVARLFNKIDMQQYGFYAPLIVGIGDLDNDDNGEILMLDYNGEIYTLYSVFIYSPI